jgi:hypothetical protein
MVLLLSYPLRKAKEEFFIRVLDKWYFWVMIPLLFILAWATTVRIDTYGLTENRVALLYLNVWLGFITVYMLTGRRIGLIMVPLSLVVFSAFALVGPLSLVDLSVHDQARVLVEVLDKNKWQRGKLTTLKKDEKLKIIDISRYLGDRKALSIINEVQTNRFPKMEVLNTKNDTLLVEQLGIDDYNIENFQSDCIEPDARERKSYLIYTHIGINKEVPLTPTRPVNVIKEFSFDREAQENAKLNEKVNEGLVNNTKIRYEDDRYLVITENNVTYLKLDLYNFLFRTSKASSSPEADLPYNKLVIPLNNQKGEVLINSLDGTRNSKKTIEINCITFTYMEYDQEHSTGSVAKQAETR